LAVSGADCTDGGVDGGMRGGAGCEWQAMAMNRATMVRVGVFMEWLI